MIPSGLCIGLFLMNPPFPKCVILLLGLFCTLIDCAQSQDSGTGSSDQPLIIARPVVDTPAPPTDGRAPLPIGLKISSPPTDPKDEIDYILDKIMENRGTKLINTLERVEPIFFIAA